jgi:hypothetical protein
VGNQADEQHLANEHICKSPQESWTCPHMVEIQSSRMDGERYECKFKECGRTMFLDYEEMR